MKEILRKDFTTPTIAFGDTHLLESKDVQPNFSFYFSFLITSQLLKKRGENDRRLVYIHLAQKNLERRTKKKQNAQVKETHHYLERSNMKITRTETWRKPIIFSSMSHEFTLSSLRPLVRRRVEQEKRNSESTSDHRSF